MSLENGVYGDAQLIKRKKGRACAAQVTKENSDNFSRQRLVLSLALSARFLK